LNAILNWNIDMQTFEGTLVAKEDMRFAIVASRFNEFVVNQLIAGAHDILVRHGASDANITLIRVPGAWEIPAACRQIAASGKFEAVVALGAVVRGSTAHFDHVASGVASGIANVAADTGIPVAFGVLTTDTMEQAIDRAGGKSGNKGHEAALAVLEMVTLSKQLSAAGY
jgi:6,7-dimethyl-8-ribityllumazine synthase